MYIVATTQSYLLIQWDLIIIYIMEMTQKTDAEAIKAQMEEADPNTPVVMIPVDDFYAGWKGMGIDEDGNPVPIDTVFIALHGEPDYIKSSNKERIYVNELITDESGPKTIGTIVLTACSTGDLNYENNFASQLAMTQNVSQVVAPDGLGNYVSPGITKSQYFAEHEDGTYVERKGNGYVLYQNIGGKLVKSTGITNNGGGISGRSLFLRARRMGSINRSLANEGFELESDFVKWVRDFAVQNIQSIIKKWS